MSTKATTSILFAALVLSACGGTNEATTGFSTRDSTASSEAAPAATPPSDATAAGGTADVTVSGKGMKGGCDAVHKMFLALDAGDKAAAQKLKDKGDQLFNDVPAEYVMKDMDVATDGAKMAATLEFTLPEEPIYESTMAKDYTAICVAKYKAAALPG